MSPLHTPAAGRGRVAQTVSACVHKRRWRLWIPNKRRNQGTGDFARAFRTSVSSPHPSCCVVQTKSQHASTKRDGGWWIPAEPRNLSTGDFAPAFRTCVPRNGSVSRERAANWWSRGGGVDRTGQKRLQIDTFDGGFQPKDTALERNISHTTSSRTYQRVTPLAESPHARGQASTQAADPTTRKRKKRWLLTDFFSANGSQGLCAWKTPGHHGAEGRS